MDPFLKRAELLGKPTMRREENPNRYIVLITPVKAQNDGQ
jgi:hypothetical protein